MNKYEEALESARETNWYNIWHLDSTVSEQMDIYLDVFEELVDKETPMKVNKKKVDCREIKVGSGTFRTIYLWSCPNCETWISPSHDERYCSCCGQRLEYEDE